MARIELPQRNLWLEVETQGRARDPAVILVMGLGLQLVSWPVVLIEALVKARRRVIVFDNRDAGLSGHGMLATTSTAPLPALLKYVLHRDFVPPYTIADMAADTLALADALKINRFDLIGVSLGGMIAQTLAVQAPARVRSLSSIMSNAGPRTAAWPTFAVLRKFLRRPSSEADLAHKLDHFTDLMVALGGLRDAQEIAALRARLQVSLTRAYNPAGTARQLLAVLAAPDRRAAVAQIRCPTLIVHGRDDPLVSLASAQAMAALIPQSRVEVLDDFGHYLPNAKMPQLARLLCQHLESAEGADAGGARTAALARA